MPRFRLKVYVDAFRIGIDSVPEWFLQSGFSANTCPGCGVVFLNSDSKDIICHMGDYVYINEAGLLKTHTEEEFKNFYTEEP